jgi:hypothetical protein
MRRFLLLTAFLAMPACLLGVPRLIEETEPDCLPGEAMACYEGPEGTRDVGNCQSGQGVCTEDGTVESCIGQVLPEVELCRTDDAEDENCDGTVNDHCALWSASFGDSGPDRLVNLAAFGDDVVIAGDYSSEIDFGGDVFQSSSGMAGFVAMFDRDGNHRWSVDLSGNETERASALSSSTDRVFVGGFFSGNLTIGGEEIFSGDSERDGFVAALMPEDGAVEWVKGFGETQRAAVLAVASLDGGVVAAGWFDGDIAFGSLGSFTTGGDDDVMVVALDAAGDPAWAVTGGGAGNDQVMDADAAGDAVFVSGIVNSALDLGCSQTIEADGDGDGFVARLNATDGSCEWLMHLSGAGEIRPRGIDTDGQRVFVGVDFQDEIDLPDGESLVSRGDLDAVVLALTPDGEAIWSRRFGDDDKQDVFTVTADGEGGVVVGGALNGSPDLGEGPIMSEDAGDDAYVIRLDDLGEVLWARTFGGDGDDDTIDASFTEGGLLYIGGEVQISMDLGQGLLTGTDIDAFVARLAP